MDKQQIKLINGAFLQISEEKDDLFSETTLLVTTRTGLLKIHIERGRVGEIAFDSGKKGTVLFWQRP